MSSAGSETPLYTTNSHKVLSKDWTVSLKTFIKYQQGGGGEIYRD